jgi:hypothetical protein
LRLMKDMPPQSRGAMRPRLDRVRPRKQEGAGNAGCALHPRSRVQDARANAHPGIGGSSVIRQSDRCDRSKSRSCGTIAADPVSAIVRSRSGKAPGNAGRFEARTCTHRLIADACARRRR